MDQVEKIVVSKENLVKLNLFWGMVGFIAATGAFITFLFNFLNLGMFSLFLASVGVIVGGINFYIYRSKPAWFLKQYAAKVLKQTGKQVVFQ
jgi:hypothetical protein